MTDSHEIVPKAHTLPAREVLHPAVAQVLKANPTPEALEKMLDLQRQWERDEAKRAYTRALVGLKQALPPWIKRDKTVDFSGAKGGRVHYTHTSLAAAMEAISPILGQHGFSLTWKTDTSSGTVTVTAELTHRDGHKESTMLSAPPDTSGSKNPAQAVASMTTLLQRYTALSLLGIATADMEDPMHGRW